MKAVCSLLCVLLVCLTAMPAQAKDITIMPLGDSITEGSSGFVVYRHSLLEKLKSAGYAVQYVGSKSGKSSKTDTTPLLHEGYGGQNISALAGKFEALYRKNPADVLLIHAGHNEFADRKPVPGMLVKTREIIKTAREINPKVKVLLAQVIPSGKLPKYEYIPELNAGLASLAQELNTPQQPVSIVNQAEGFDWKTDTIADMVHPNAQGAEKMAARWFEALQKALPPPKK